MATLQETQLDLESGGGNGGGDDTRRGSGSSDGSDESYTTSNDTLVMAPTAAVDLEMGGGEVDNGDGNKVHLVKIEKDCRICHLSLDVNSEESGNGIPIELGCSCKDDLAAAHKQCAEAWFKIKGNRTCEICGSTAKNVAGVDEAEPIDQWSETNGSTPSRAAAPMATSETRNFWQGHRFLNFLLASMVFAFVISWLFHFNVPS